MKKPDLSLILPCYNEASLFRESFRRILETLKNSRFSFEIIFVDDGSRDITPELIAQALRQYSFCRAIYHQVNAGRGRAVAHGIRAARGLVVGYIDIDLEVSPVYIPEMLAIILKNRADVVIGRRVYRTTLTSIIREALSRGYQWLADFAIGTAGLDTESGYKFFRRGKILSILPKAKHPNWFWDTEIIVYAKRRGLRIIEIPVLFLRRTDKKSSVRVIPDMLDYLVSLWNLKKRL